MTRVAQGESAAPAHPTQEPWVKRQMLSSAVASPPALRDNRGPPPRCLISTGRRFETTMSLPSSFIVAVHRPEANLARNAEVPREAAARHQQSWDGVQAEPELQVPVL